MIKLSLFYSSAYLVTLFYSNAYSVPPQCNCSPAILACIGLVHLNIWEIINTYCTFSCQERTHALLELMQKNTSDTQI